MKKIVLFSLMLLFSGAWGNEDSQNKQDSFEQLMKEFEKIRHKPNSLEHYTWFARCANNEECRQSVKKNFEKLSKEELIEMTIDSMALNGKHCIAIQEIEETQKELEEAQNEIEKKQKEIEETQNEIEENHKEIDNRVNKLKKFERGYHFVVGGLLTSGGALCILNNDNILFGTVSVAAGLFSFLRFFIE